MISVGLRMMSGYLLMIRVDLLMINGDLLTITVDLLQIIVGLLMTPVKAPMILLLSSTDHQPLINRNHEMIMNPVIMEHSILWGTIQLMPMIKMITVPTMIFLRCSRFT